MGPLLNNYEFHFPSLSVSYIRRGFHALLPKKLNTFSLVSTLAHHLRPNPDDQVSLKVVLKGLQSPDINALIEKNLHHFRDLTLSPWFDYMMAVKGELNASLLVLISALSKAPHDYRMIEANVDLFVEAELRKYLIEANVKRFVHLFSGQDMVVQDQSERCYLASYASESLKYFVQDKKLPKSGIISYLGLSFDKEQRIFGQSFEFLLPNDGVLSLTLVRHMLLEIQRRIGICDLAGFELWLDSSIELGQWLLAYVCLNFGAKQHQLVLPSMLFSYDPCISFFQFLSSEHEAKIYVDINWNTGRAHVFVIGHK